MKGDEEKGKGRGGIVGAKDAHSDGAQAIEGGKRPGWVGVRSVGLLPKIGGFNVQTIGL